MPPSPDHRRWGGSTRRGRKAAPRALLPVAFLLAAALPSFPAAAEKVKISALSDVDFGLISNLQADARRSQNICLFSQSNGGRYSITATGSGAGSAFTLSNGTSALPYEVQWSDQSGQTGGTALAPNVPSTGRTSSATQHSCISGPSTSASLTIVLRSSSLTQARAGSYSGSLTLLVAAE